MLSELKTVLEEPEYILPVLLVIPIVVTAAVAVVASMTVFQWRRIREAEYDAALKQEMLERGMSADEIATVIASSHRRPALTVRKRSVRRESREKAAVR